MHLQTTAQDFQGIRGSNYNGVNGLQFNPSSIADNIYKWDVNIIAGSFGIANNLISSTLKDLRQSIKDSISRVTYKIPNGRATALLSTAVYGPSAMYSFDNKSAIAISTALRGMAYAGNWDGDESRRLLDPNENIVVPYYFETFNQPNITAHAWSEIGVTYARVLKDEEHYLKGGITFKYLRGLGNVYLQVADVKGELNGVVGTQELYLQKTSGMLDLGIGGLNAGGFKEKDLPVIPTSGFGAAIGFTYEYRPSYRSTDFYRDRENLHQYQFKLAMSITDIGALNYKRDQANSGTFLGNMEENEQWYYNRELTGRDVDEIVPYLDSKSFITRMDKHNSPAYTVWLPTALHLDMDYHFRENYFLNLSATAGITHGNKPWSYGYYPSITITPRFENRWLSFFLPVSYNIVSKTNIGAAARLGPFFLGTGSLLKGLVTKSKQADFYLGLHLSGMPGSGERIRIIRDRRTKDRGLDCYQF